MDKKVVRNPLLHIASTVCGRCNFTYHCTEGNELIKNYPRGQKELRGPFTQYGVQELINFFENNKVLLHTEPDGRMFPLSNDSQSIIDCLIKKLYANNVLIKTQTKVKEIIYKNDMWQVTNIYNDIYIAKKLLITVGSSNTIWQQLYTLGHSIIPPVPSLFSFIIDDNDLTALTGISHPHVSVSVCNNKETIIGAVLITHQGVSGPAILRLSAWQAIPLAASQYQFEISINWTYKYKSQEVLAILMNIKTQYPKNKLQIIQYFSKQIGFGCIYAIELTCKPP